MLVVNRNINFATMINLCDIKTFFVGSILVGLVSCAQVRTLEGGAIDEQAPYPVEVVPPNKTTNFNQQQIKITFNEFVKLNNPLQTISVIPNDLNIRTELHNKTLVLSWDEELRENTTYSIFLNRTVKDITESNDSIMQLVFSSGQQIDSFSYSAFVVNAESGLPESNVLVGLFDHPDSIKPIYFTQTNENGFATLNYLKEGEFYVRAFSDELKQAKIGKKDRIGFKNEAIYPDTNLIDSLPLQMFAPLEEPKITSFEYTPPNLFTVKTNRTIYDTTKSVKISINDNEIQTTQLSIIEPDSVAFMFDPADNNLMILKIETDEWTDSTRLRIQNNRKKLTAKVVAKQNYFLPQQRIELSTSALIYDIDTTQIEIINLSDSTKIYDYSWEINNNFLFLWITHKENERTKIKILPSAFKLNNDWKIEEFEETFTHKSAKELGILNLTVDNILSNIVVEMLHNNVVVRRAYRQAIDNNKLLTFTELEPGDYTFRIIEDSNGNKQWDTGDFSTKKQAEKIHFFSTPITIRANWEIEATISIEE